MRILPGFLTAISSRPRLAWIGLMAYAAAVTFPHENVQYVVNELAIRFTHQRVFQSAAALALAGGTLLTCIVLKRLARNTERRRLTAFWFLTLALIFGAWRLFTANNTELVHYPQYLPEGMALATLTLSPVESLAWVALFGGLDEGFQYAVLNRARSVPFDFNDVYMDLLGGALGVLLALAFLPCEARGAKPLSWRRLLKRPGVVIILAIILTGVLLWSGGWMLLYTDPANSHYWFALSRHRSPAFWFQEPTNGPNRYHTLSPIEGPILILATIALYATLDRRLRISAK